MNPDADLNGAGGRQCSRLARLLEVPAFVSSYFED